jgi:hypothetical protein
MLCGGNAVGHGLAGGTVSEYALHLLQRTVVYEHVRDAGWVLALGG